MVKLDFNFDFRENPTFKENDIQDENNESRDLLALKNIASDVRKRTLKKEKSMTLMINNNRIHGSDPENGNWLVDGDLNSSFLRCSIVYQDVFKIPRNHLR